MNKSVFDIFPGIIKIPSCLFPVFISKFRFKENFHSFVIKGILFRKIDYFEFMKSFLIFRYFEIKPSVISLRI